MAYRDEPEFQGGAIVVDKARCWRPLNLTMHLNEWSDFYYQHLFGDKDTFHLAWRMLDRPYAMPWGRPGLLDARRGDERHAIFELLDFQGRAIFHHRVGASKWSAWGENFRAPDFASEDECLAALAELRALWSGRSAFPSGFQPAAGPRADATGQHTYLYCRLGDQQRIVELLPDGTIGRGSSWTEQRWRLEQGAGRAVMLLESGEGEAARLTRDQDGAWRGRLSREDRGMVELVPVEPSGGSATAV